MFNIMEKREVGIKVIPTKKQLQLNESISKEVERIHAELQSESMGKRPIYIMIPKKKKVEVKQATATFSPKKGLITYAGKMKLVSKIESFEELYEYLKTNEVIFHRHKCYSSAFFIQWRIATCEKAIIDGMFWSVAPVKKSFNFFNFFNFLGYGK